MEHGEGVTLDAGAARMFSNRTAHNPGNLSEARDLAERDDVYPIGVFYKDRNAWRYDEVTQQGFGRSQAEKAAAVEAAISRFAV
jgi:hypothetical protein